MVVDRIRLILVERQENESLVIVEARVLEERHEPVLEPGRNESDICVVAVVDKVGGDEDPLRDRRGIDISSKVVEVTLEVCARWYRRNRIVEDQRVVLADIVRVRRSRCVYIVVGCEAGEDVN